MNCPWRSPSTSALCCRPEKPSDSKRRQQSRLRSRRRTQTINTRMQTHVLFPRLPFQNGHERLPSLSRYRQSLLDLPTSHLQRGLRSQISRQLVVLWGGLLQLVGMNIGRRITKCKTRLQTTTVSLQPCRRTPRRVILIGRTSETDGMGRSSRSSSTSSTSNTLSRNVFRYFFCCWIIFACFCIYTLIPLCGV